MGYSPWGHKESDTTEAAWHAAITVCTVHPLWTPACPSLQEDGPEAAEKTRAHPGSVSDLTQQADVPVLLQLHNLASFKKPSFSKLFLFFLFPICFIPIITSWENGIKVPKSQSSEHFIIIIIFSQAMRLVEVSACLRLGQVSQGYLAQGLGGQTNVSRVS